MTFMMNRRTEAARCPAGQSFRGQVDGRGRCRSELTSASTWFRRPNLSQMRTQLRSVHCRLPVSGAMKVAR